MASSAGAQRKNSNGAPSPKSKPPLKVVHSGDGSPRASQGPKLLRACVVQGGRIVEEQLLQPKAPLSIGTSPKNEIVVAAQDMPSEHGLFVYKGNHYQLVFTDGMRGKISVAGQNPTSLQDLKQSASKSGGGYALDLTEKHRGKIVVGDITIIFQFVYAPLQAQTSLPKEVRGSFWQQVDWNYASLLIGIFIFEALGAFGLSFVPDPPAEIKLEDAGSRFVKVVVPDYEPKKPEPEKPKQQSKDKNDNGPKTKKLKKVDDSDPKAAKKRAERKAAIRENISNAGLLQVLGTVGGDGSGGAVADVFGSSSLDGDIADAFSGVQGVGVATQTVESARGGGAGKKAGIGLGTKGGGKVGLGAKAERRVAAVKTAAPDVDGELDSAAVAKVVRSRLRAVQDCYEKELKRDPNLSGRVEVEFTIAESGRIEEAEVVENTMGSQAVGACIVSRIRRWRFPAPDGGSVTVAYPFIFSSSK